MATSPLVTGQGGQPQVTLIVAGLQALQQLGQADVQASQRRELVVAPIKKQFLELHVGTWANSWSS